MGSWSEYDRDVARTLWARGVQSRDILPHVSKGITRNALMGMLNRMGLMGLGHAGPERIATMAQVAAIMGEDFSLGAPLHAEALLALLSASTPRHPDALAKVSGVCRADCERFLDRLPLVWPEGEPMPERWQGSLEGKFAFILDMAFVSGVLEQAPVRGGDEADPV